MLKLAVRTGLRLYCSRIRFDVHPQRGPAILACNHPNSFLDALIIGSHYQHPIHFLARGDAFAKPVVARLLRRMNMIPIHRLSEGRAGLKENEQSFAECLTVLRAGGTLLIFSEGICKNEAGLRPLKKGTARLARAAWQEDGLTDMIVKPVALSYSGFTRLPVSVEVEEGQNILRRDVAADHPAQFHHRYNALLQESLLSSLRSLDEKKREKKRTLGRKMLLALPATIGWVTHKPLFLVLKGIATRKTSGTVFYHSVLFGLLLLVYPMVLVITTVLVVLLTGVPFFGLALLVLPFTAWCYKAYRA